MSFTILLLSPDADPSWPGKISRAVPGTVAKIYADPRDALADIETTEAAYGTVPPELFAKAKKLRWICASRAGPGWAGRHVYDALVKSDVVVTGMHGSYNEHLSTPRSRFCSPLPGGSSTAGYGGSRLIAARCIDQKAFPKSAGLLRQQLHDPVDELFGGVDRRAGAVKRYVGIGPQPVIGDRLEVVGLGEELTQLETESGLVSRQPGKLGVHALVGLGVFARALRDQRLRRVRGREVGIAAGVFA